MSFLRMLESKKILSEVKMNKLLLIIAIFASAFQFASAQWEPCNAGISEFNNQAVLVSGNDIYIGGTGGIYLSTDFGESWIDLNLNLSRPTVLSIFIKDSILFIGTVEGVYLYNEQQNQWVQKINGMTKLPVMAIDKIGNDLIAGTTKGVFISSDNGDNWEARNKGIDIVFIYKFFVQDDIIIAGSIVRNGTGGGLYLSTDKG